MPSDKACLAQCRRLLPSPSHLLAWCAVVHDSSLAVCRFLHSASPLLGLWAHQNPELGNLHGNHPDSLFPGLLSSLHPQANTLLLEAHNPQAPIPSSSHFSRLAFGDRRRLLDALVAACRVTLLPELTAALLFACSEKDHPVLAARRESMLRLHGEASGGMVHRPEVEALLLGAKKMPPPTGDTAGERMRLRRSLSAMARSVKNGLRQMVTRSASANSRAAYADSKHLALDDFLRAGDNVGLSLWGTRMRLSTYRAWPSMHGNIRK